MNRTSEIKIPKLLLLVIMAAVLAVGMGMSSVVSFAGTESGETAKTGSYSISGKYAPWENMKQTDVDALGSTKLTLYRVGSFARDDDGNSYIALDDTFNYTMPNYKKSDAKYEGEDGEILWTKDWLAVAATIADKIEADSDLAERLKVGDTNTGTGGAYSFSGLTTGVYLIAGESQEITVDGKTTHWWPQPMLVQVLQSNATANLKPLTGDFRNFTVVKSWSGGDASTRPTSIKVIVSYDGEQQYEFTLNEGNQWTATWKAKAGQNDASKWSVVEQTDTGSLNYTTVITEATAGDAKTYNITNTYNPPPTDKTLELVKSVPVYLQHADGKTVSTSFTFEISGYLGNDLVYHRYAGMQFDKDGKQTLTITGIPDGLTRVVVKEVPTANYTVTGGAEKEAVLSGDLYKVEFENTYNDTTHYDGGVINKYKQTGGKYVFDFREGIVLK